MLIQHAERLRALEGRLRSLEERASSLGDEFVSRPEFLILRTLAYGMIATILLAVLGALVRLVVR